MSSILYAQNQYIAFSTEASTLTSIEPIRTIKDNGMDGVTIDYKFNKAIVHTKSNQNIFFQYFYIKGFSQCQNIGKPMLPVHTDLIYIPEGANFNIQIIDSDNIVYNNFNIFPALKLPSDNSGDSLPIFIKDHDAYQSSTYYPQNPVQIKDIIKIKGLRFALIEVHPIQIKTIDGELKLFSNIKYKINFTNTTNLINCNKYSKDLLYQISNIALNNYYLKENINLYLNSPEYKNRDKINYLIITHQDYIKAADNISNWKKQLGYRTKIIKSVNWTSSTIKQEITNLQQNQDYDLDYILILGNINKIPSINILKEQYKTEYSDLYYACFDGPNDYFPDAAIARISVNNTTEAINTISKIINYEKQPTNINSFYNSACVISSYKSHLNDYDKYRYTETAEEISKLLEIKSLNVSRLYFTQSSIIPKYWNNNTYSDGESIPNYLKKPYYKWNASSSNITKEINDGKFLIIYRSNSWTGGWNSPYFNSTMVNKLNNTTKLPIIFSIGGKSGNFSDPNCFANNFLKKQNSGAISIIANGTKSYSGYNNGISLSLVDAIWPNNKLINNFQTIYNNTQEPINYPISKIGFIKNQGIARMIEVWGSSSNYIRLSIESLNLFGDPSMEIWHKSPQLITATTKDSLYCNSDTSLIINSNIGGLATLIVNKEIISSKVINAGIDTLFFSNISGENAILTISNDEYKPKIINIPIVGNCVYSNFKISSNSFCLVDSIIVSNLSTNKSLSYNWTFGEDSHPNSRQGFGPFNIIYTSGGIKEITLIVNDSNNNSSQHTEEILVDSQCVKAIPINGNIINSECSGILTDNGYSGNYLNNSFGSYTISPIGASNVSIDFEELDLGNNSDKIYIYDGPNTESPLLIVISGNTIPNNSIISTGSSVTIQLKSDGNTNGSGFLLKWHCTNTNSSPIADLISLDSNSCSNTIHFFNKSIDANNSIWYFGDGQSSTKQHPYHTYNQNGLYNVKLVVYNQYGIDSIVKNNYINIHQIDPPSINDEIRCNRGTVSFDVHNNSNTIYWYSNDNDNILDSGNQYTTPIIENTTIYYASQKKYNTPLSFGKTDSIGYGGYNNLSENSGLFFDVNINSTLFSVDVYANSNGDRQVFLYNSANEIVYSKITFLTTGKNTIKLDWDINQGINYKICTSSNANLFYNTENISFPYTDRNNNITITRSDFNNKYLYFYNWRIQNKSCISKRIKVLAIISDTLKPETNFTTNITGANADFVNTTKYASTYYWDFGDSNFSLLPNPSHFYQYSGVYNVTLISANDCGSRTTSKQIQIINTSLEEIDDIIDLKIYPNPASSILNINFNTYSNQDIRIKLFNIVGQNVFNRSYKPNYQSQDIKIHTKVFKTGIYILSIETGNKIIQKRVIFE